MHSFDLQVPVINTIRNSTWRRFSDLGHIWQSTHYNHLIPELWKATWEELRSMLSILPMLIVWMLCASANTESIWKKHLMCITSTFSQAPHIDLSHFLSSHSLSQSQNPWIPINFSFFPLSSFTRIKNLLLIIHNVWNTSCNSPHILLLSVTLSLWWWPRY